MKLDLSRFVNKRILLHILFWVFYVLFFGSIYGKYGNDYSWYLFESLCMLPFVMTATYTTIYVLLPYYLRKRNLFVTVLLLVLLVFTITLFERIALRTINQLPVTFDSLFGVTFLYLMLETNFMVAIAFAIKIVKKWKVQQEEKFEMEKLNLQSELNLLKAQLHPHFLFNTMNNLYALSLEESTKTSEGIAKISELLRSILYDCNDVEIELDKEIKLIENYIDLEKMRHGKGLKISFEVKGETKNKTIAPMLFFTFVENCFKHCCSNESGNSSIDVVISVVDNVIQFYAGNSKNGNKNGNDKKNAGGIGLKNVQKRLEIIYTNNYDLKINDIHNKFEVSLSITK